MSYQGDIHDPSGRQVGPIGSGGGRMPILVIAGIFIAVTVGGILLDINTPRYGAPSPVATETAVAQLCSGANGVPPMLSAQPPMLSTQTVTNYWMAFHTTANKWWDSSGNPHTGPVTIDSVTITSIGRCFAHAVVIFTRPDPTNGNPVKWCSSEDFSYRVDAFGVGWVEEYPGNPIAGRPGDGCS